MMSLLSSKRGTLDNYLVVLIVLITFAISTIIGMVLFLSVDTELATTGFYSSNVSETMSAYQKALQLFDYVFVVLLFIMIIGVALTSFKINASPVFFVVSIIGGIFFIFVSLFFNVFMRMFFDQSVFTSALLYFPKTVYICQNLQWVALLTFIVGSIALYAKKEKGEFIQ